MTSPEHNLGSSRHEYRLRRRLDFTYDQHMSLAKEIVYLAQSLDTGPSTPSATVLAYEGVDCDTSGRKMSLTSSKQRDRVLNLGMHFYGGIDNKDSLSYEYQPSLDAYFKTINYSQNKYVVTPVSVTADIMQHAPAIELPAMDDTLTVAPEALEAALLTHAESHPRESYTISKRYEYHDLDDLNADVIIHDINGHTKHYVFDVYTHVNKDGLDLLIASNYEFEVDGINPSPSGRALLEVIAQQPLTAEQQARYTDVSPEESLLYFTAAIKRTHASLVADDISS